MFKRGFDNKKYIQEQTKAIYSKLNIHDRIYIEIGGKLLYDGHSKRVLPGYNPENKINLFKNIPDIEIIYCINANDISSKRKLSNFNLSNQNQALKDIKKIRKAKLKINSVVITRYDKQKGVKEFKQKIEKKGIKVFIHKEIEGYGKNIAKTIKGYKNQPKIPVSEKIILITGVGGGSGKMATTMSQLYKDRKNKIDSSYTKFETFPIWNLPLNHPINLAYEAATANLGDKNLIDPYHLKKYKITAINYNRDVENFKILKKLGKELFQKGKFTYHSPTDMGINYIKTGIINETICKNAAKKEIKKRLKKYTKELKKGRESINTIKRMKEIMRKLKK